MKTVNYWIIAYWSENINLNRCRELGSSLASIHSVEESDHILQTAAESNADLWIGMTKTADGIYTTDISELEEEKKINIWGGQMFGYMALCADLVWL